MFIGGFFVVGLVVVDSTLLQKPSQFGLFFGEGIDYSIVSPLADFSEALWELSWHPPDMGGFCAGLRISPEYTGTTTAIPSSLSENVKFRHYRADKLR
jgi:hypothetical protein